MAYIDRRQLNNMNNQIMNNRSKIAELERKIEEARNLLKTKNNAIQNNSKIMDEIGDIIGGIGLQFQQECAILNENVRLEIEQQNQKNNDEINEILSQIKKTDQSYGETKNQLLSLNREMDEIINRIEETNHRERLRAENLLNQLTLQFARFEKLHMKELELLYPDRLSPGYTAIRSAIQQVKANISNQEYQAAIGVAQNYIPHAINIHAQLETLNEGFQSCASLAEESLNKAINYDKEISDGIRDMKAVVNYMEYENVSGHDIDYWSMGIYGEVKLELDEAIDLLNLGMETYDSRKLRKAKERLDIIHCKLEKCHSIADTQFKLSCMCQETCYMIASEICRYSPNEWRETNQCFLDDDERGTYIQSVTDSNIEVHIVTSPDRTQKNASIITEIVVFGLDGLRDNPNVCAIRKAGIISQLQQNEQTRRVFRQGEKNVISNETQDSMYNSIKAYDEKSIVDWKNYTAEKIQSKKLQ